MSSTYQPLEIEKRLMDYWEKENVYQTPALTSPKKKKYILSMFPYPSGDGLHMGHVRIYTGTDVVARYFRMKGFSVLHPMGWDAFGLPAENAAIKKKVNPMEMVPQNIANFKKQMKNLGLSYNWDRELSTADPKYYGLTQQLFILFFRLGLLDKKTTFVYFCDKCKTGLAEEEVLSDGTHERCGNKITKKELPQWVFKITQYAESLLLSLKDLDWPKGILEMQRNWIGKKEGAEITFNLAENNFKTENIKVFTTRPDTIFGATALVIAPEHSLTKEIIKKTDKYAQRAAQYVQEANSKSDLQRTELQKEKSGVFSGVYALHPVTKAKLPIWIADYVLGEFGTGAIMLVPGHDVRDFEFAKTYKIPIKRVIAKNQAEQGEITTKDEVWEDFSGTLINSDFLNKLSVEAAFEKIIDYLAKQGGAKKSVSYHLRDWIFSRQRYWGEPIPMVYCEHCAEKGITWWDTQKGKVDYQKAKTIKNLKFKINNSLAGWFPLSEAELPLKLPYLKQYEPTGDGKSPLSTVKDWVNTKCPHCGGQAVRETDTMPNWAGSCWYFLRFAMDNKNPKSQIPNPNQNLNKQIQNLETKPNKFGNWDLEIGNFFSSWLPVDWYLGGAEHAVLHLLYARFWMHILNDLGSINFREPFIKLRNVGMVLSYDHRKMSKSLGNIINPDDIIVEFGADTIRLYEMFMAPFDAEVAWSKKSLAGCNRFLKRIYQFFNQYANIAKYKIFEEKKTVSELQRLILKVDSDITNVKFNTAIAACMKFLNLCERNQKEKASSPTLPLSVKNARVFLQLLSPFTPFITDYFWLKVFQGKKSIHLSNWPNIETDHLTQEEIIIPIQINGKIRANLTLHLNKADEENVISKALKLDRVIKYIKNQKYKTIYVKNKILSIVIK